MSALYTAKLAGDPLCGCTLTPHSDGSRLNASSARCYTAQVTLGFAGLRSTFGAYNNMQYASHAGG